MLILRREFIQGALALGTLGCFAVDSQASIYRRKAYLTMDADTGKIVLSQQASASCYPASTTKLMTLYLIFEALEADRLTWDTKIRFSENAANTIASKLWVNEGYEMTVRSAVKALIVKSANDVAVAVAEHMDGSVNSFANRMNGATHFLEMNSTTFKNPHGLPNADHITTANDMSKLALALIRWPKYYPLLGTQTWGNHSNTNKLLFTYPGCDGLKTGYTQASGSNLVASAKRGGKRALVVYFGGASASVRNREVASLLDRTFARM